MLKPRLIAVLIVRNGQVVQSVKFKHTNVIHVDPVHAIECFNKWSIDEIIVLNVSKDSGTKKDFLSTIQNISKFCFVPLTAGGWITDEDYAESLLANGADKICLNTAIFDFPDVVRKLSEKYGKQCIVASVDFKKNQSGQKTVHIDRGEADTGDSVRSWLTKATKCGVGEILFNNIDHDGNRRGYDLETLEELVRLADVPVIAFGGVLEWEHLAEGLRIGANAVAAANVLHYKEHSAKRAKRFLVDRGFIMRSE